MTPKVTALNNYILKFANRISKIRLAKTFYAKLLNAFKTDNRPIIPVLSLVKKGLENEKVPHRN